MNPMGAPAKSHPSYGLNALIAFLSVTGILVLLNAMGEARFFRLDLTRDRSQTISDTTKKILGDLQDLCTIRTYITRELPPEFLTSHARVMDLLHEYQAYGEGKVLIEEVDPDAPTEENRLRQYGIQPLQVTVMHEDKVEAQNIYAGLTITYGSKTEAIPVIQAIAPNSNTFDMEYDLTQTIVKVSSRDSKRIAFLNGHEEQGPYQDWKELTEDLKKVYTVDLVNPSDGKPIPEDTSAVIVAGPKGLDEVSKYALDQYLVKGGGVLLCVQKVDVPLDDRNGLQGQERATGLDDWCQFLGVKVNGDLVRDVGSPRPINVGLPFPIEYSLWPQALPKFWDAGHPTLQRLRVLTFPWAGSLEPVEAKSGVNPSIIVKTSPYAVAMQSPFQLDPMALQKSRVNKEDCKTLNLAVAAAGKFKSFYADKTPPKPPAPAEGAEKPPEPLPQVKEGTKEGRLVVIGDADLFNATHIKISQCPENVHFGLNIVDWLARNEAMSAIRPRSVAEAPMKPFKDDDRWMGLPAATVIKLLGIGGMPFLVALFGLLRWAWRRHQTNRFLSRLTQERASSPAPVAS